ncbi:MAG: L-threonylcarbamoyladenylate synthase [Chitinophagaceae bacterium]|nr:L-threonylcarbamoyladenylate synthase [Chitinophagaceae bacterium]
MYTTTIGESVAEAADWLKKGEVVALPTETVYGLAGNALNEAAVLRIFKAKNRPHFNPLIVHTHSLDMAGSFVANMPDAAIDLAKAFWPGPLTLLLKKQAIVPDLVTAGSEKVAIRIPAHPVALSLLSRLSFPLAAPSANRFGYVSPTTAAHVMQGLAGVIPYILDGGPCGIGVESTIVDIEDNKLIIRRKGGISLEMIRAVAKVEVLQRTHAHEHPVAPGQLKSHYATQTPLYLGNLPELLNRFAGSRIAVIGFGEPSEASVYAHFNLSEKGDADEAARNLFKTMREADDCGAEVILAGLLPEIGIGAAINDRLKRASVVNKTL